MPLSSTAASRSRSSRDAGGVPLSGARPFRRGGELSRSAARDCCPGDQAGTVRAGNSNSQTRASYRRSPRHHAVRTDQGVRRRSVGSNERAELSLVSVVTARSSALILVHSATLARQPPLAPTPGIARAAARTPRPHPLMPLTSRAGRGPSRRPGVEPCGKLPRATGSGSLAQCQ